jgi:hypothetical protein
MTLENFKLAPWKESHHSYSQSPLALNPAPEYADSEVLISGLYRTVGLAGVSEGKVPARGRELDRQIAESLKKGSKPAKAALFADAFHGLLRSVLESPKRPNQSTKRFLQVSPIVGETAYFSGSARLTGNPWPAGMLTRRMIRLGTGSEAAAKATWEKLFLALNVEDREDVFAHFVMEELRAWLGDRWDTIAQPKDGSLLDVPLDGLVGRAFPARQFVVDLQSLLAAKPLMTRRQWVSLLEALIRLAAVSHVAWICEVQQRIWEAITQALKVGPPAADLGDTLFPNDFKYLSYGAAAISGLRDRTSKYLKARLGINAALWALEGIGKPFPSSLTTAADVQRLCQLLHDNRGALASLLADVDEVADREARTLLCRKGIGSNLIEFARYVLMQRQAADARLRGYDQGYILRRRATSRSSPWICAPGPVAVLAIVHCALAGVSGPRSVRRFSQHLAAYGIAIDHREIGQSELGQQLRMLGLVLDSPDAESGMLLVPPFATPSPGPGSLA